MKVWLDDRRDAADGWLHVRTPDEAIELLRTGQVEEISLDHDLGLFTTEGKEWTGYAVLKWLEHEVATGTAAFDIPIISIHSANPVGRKRMEQAIASIARLLRDKTAERS